MSKLTGAPGWFIDTVEQQVRNKAPGWFTELVLDKEQIDQQEEERAQERHELLSNKTDGEFEENLLSFVRDKEAGRWGYDAWVHRGTSLSPPAPPKKPTEMTYNEVLDWQREVRAMGFDSAIGGYQTIYTTLRDAGKALGLTGNERFDRNLQDRIASDYLLRKKRRISIDDYVNGKATKEEFANDLAKEWAGLPVLAPTSRKNVNIQPGQSYYKGVGTNRSVVKGPELGKYSEMFDLAKIDNNEGEV